MKGNEELARSIIPVSSDPSGFARGTIEFLRITADGRASFSLPVASPFICRNSSISGDVI